MLWQLFSYLQHLKSEYMTVINALVHIKGQRGTTSRMLKRQVKNDATLIFYDLIFMTLLYGSETLVKKEKQVH